MPKDHIFISDVHIAKIDDESQTSLVKFLESVKATAGSLYFLGDLFDFWYGYKSVVYHEYIPLLNKLIELKNSGVELYLLEGNHEFRFDLFFGDVLNAHVSPKFLEKEINNKKFYLTHGDSIDTIDIGHKVLNFFLKNKPVHLVVGLSHPGFWWRVARIVSEMSRSRLDRGSSKLFKAYESFAKKKFSEGVDVAIFGHSHEPKIQKQMIDGKEKFSIYLGDWLTQHCYLKSDGDNFEMCYYK